MADYIWPVKTKEYVGWIFDSTKWNDFAIRDDDIIITTYAKSGTTWMQQIVGQLLSGGDPSVYGDAISPFIESRIHPDPVGKANAQTGRRFLKTHLPIETLPYSPAAKYIYVGRDARDVFWSWYNHYANFRPEVLGFINSLRADGEPEVLPPDPDIRVAFHAWLDSDGKPNSPFWDHARGWWAQRDAPNLLVTHFARLKADLEGEIRRVAQFLGIAVDTAAWPAIIAHSGFEHMKRQAAQQEVLDRIFVGGGATFINKGFNGRWRDVLTAADLAKFDATVARELPPACAHWLATGEMPAQGVA
jgi:aryl sulfotransferase